MSILSETPNHIHSIVFNYIPAGKIHRLESLLSSSNITELKALTDRYVLMSAKKHDDEDDEIKYIHMCDIIEIMWDDLKESDEDAHKEYDRLIDEYGKEVMDLFVLFDANKMESKITKLIETAFKAFKCNELEIQITKHDTSKNLVNTLNEILHNHFDVKDSQDLRFNNVIIIEKRGN